MPRDRKESDVPNDSEEDSSSEDSSGSDSGSSSSGSNGSESDSKKTSGEKRDSSHKTGSPGRAGRNNEINSSGRGKEKSGENGSDHGRDNDGGYKHRNSRDKTDERTKVKDAEGDISSDGEQITRSGPRSTIVQKSSVTRKDNETKERSEDLGKRTLFKEPEKRDRERRDDDEESQRRRRTRSRSPRNRESERGKDYRGRDDKPRRPDNRDDKGRQRDRDDDSRKHENRRREERQDYDRSRRDREVDDKRRDRDEGNQEERSRRDREPSGQRKVRDEGHQDNDRSRRDRDGESGRRGRDEGRRDDWRRERETTRARSNDRDRRHERDRDLRNDARQNDDKENRRDENTSRKRPADEGEQVKGKEDMGQPVEKKSKTAEEELLTSRTGGAYIPPARLRMMQAQITDKSSVPYQRMAWEALKKSVNGLINKVNVSNIVDIVRELFQENIVRGRGLLARSVVQAQAASPTFTHVYAALVAIINTKFPQIGELILQRLILQFKRGYRRNDKSLCMSSTRFIAHLVNQQVAHEVISLEILTLLLENVTEDSVEVAVSFLKECGQKLTEVSPKGINAIFERLRSVLHEGQIDKRVQYMVEVMFAIRKDGFKDHPAVIADLDLVEEDDQFTHLLTLEDVTTAQDELNVFKADDRYIENEEKYKTLKKEILDEGSSDDESGDESGSDSSSEEEEQEEEAKQDIIDNTETNMVALRRTIYLTIQSSLDFEECAHKLLKMEMKPGQEVELCYMILDCCAQLRTYEKFFGLLAQRFCQLDKKYVEPYQNIFREQFETIHRLDTNKLRNVAKFFAHLLHTDAISWGVMSCMKLTEEDTTSASRIFIKILFLELSEYMGLPKLNARLRDPTLQEYFEGIMPRNNPKDTRFAINFFTTIGLGGLTEDLREHLKGISKQLMQQKQQQQQDQAPSSSSSDSSESGSSDSGSSDSSESDSSDSDSSDSDSESSESSSNSEAERRRKKKDTGRGRQDGGTRRPQGQRRANRPDQGRERLDAGGMNGVTRADGRPRIEDKLLKLSLAGEAPIIDFSHGRASSNPPQDRSKRGNRPKGKRGFRNKRQGRRNQRLSAADTGGRGRNSDCDYRANSSYDGQNSDRGDAGMERDYYRGDRITRDDRIVSRPRSPDVEDRRDRHHMVSEEMMMERRGRRREVDVSPRGDRGDSMRSPRRDHRDAERSPQRRDRRVIDVSPRHADRREAPSPRRRGDVASPPRYGMESPPRRGGGRDASSISNRGDRRDANSPPRLVDRRDFDGAPPRRDRREVASPNRGDYESSPHHRDRRRDPTDSSHRREPDRSPPMGTRKEQKQVEYSRNGNRRGGADRYSHIDRRSSGRSPSPNPVRENRKEKRAREQEVVSSSPDNGDHQKHLGHRDRHAVSDRTKDRRRR